MAVDELQSVFNRCQVEGNAIKPPEEQLDRALYLEYKKWMTRNCGKWKSNKQRFEFEYDPAILLRKLQAGERPNFRSDWHYFPTTPPVIDLMFNIHIPSEGERILEPSAGQGALVFGQRDFICVECDWSLIEMNPLNRAELKKNGLGDLLIWDDFDTYTPAAHYDLVAANPPFKLIGPHVEKMIDCVCIGGCILTVVPANFDSTCSKVLERVRDHFMDTNLYEVPDDAFKASGTSVRTKVLYASGRE